MVGSRSGRVRKSLELKTGWDASRIMDDGWAPPPALMYMYIYPGLSCPARPAARGTNLPRYSMSGIYSAGITHACLHPGKGRAWARYLQQTVQHQLHP